MKNITFKKFFLETWDSAEIKEIPFAKRYGLYIRVPKLREQMLSKQSPASLIVCVGFDRKGISIQLVNGVYSSERQQHVAFDPYTNRYPEYPATFTISYNILKAKKYFIAAESKPYGDFLILRSLEGDSTTQTTRDSFIGHQELILNLSSVFMFESLEITNGGKIFYRRHQVASRKQSFPFFAVFDEYPSDTLRKKMENFEKDSFLHITSWLPFMDNIQANEAIYFGGKESPSSDKEGIAAMQKSLLCLP